MMSHLIHMAIIRPDGPDRDAAKWAMAEIERLRAARLRLRAAMLAVADDPDTNVEAVVRLRNVLADEQKATER